MSCHSTYNVHPSFRLKCLSFQEDLKGTGGTLSSARLWTTGTKNPLTEDVCPTGQDFYTVWLSKLMCCSPRFSSVKEAYSDLFDTSEEIPGRPPANHCLLSTLYFIGSLRVLMGLIVRIRVRKVL